MFEIIEKLRQKPDRTKKQIAFLVAFLLTGIIFIIWLSVIYPSFRQDQKKLDAVAKIEPSPLQALGETFSTGASALGEEFGKLRETISSFTTNLTSSSSAPITPTVEQ